MKFPQKPANEIQILEEIREITKNDGLIRKVDGGVLGMVSEPSSLVIRLYMEFLETNYLYGSQIYPGIVKMEREAISMLADFLGDETATGDVVAGGTVANILAIKAARDRFKKEKPNIVLPVTAHPSFLKGCQLLAVEPRRIPCDQKTHRSIPADMEQHIDDNTVALVGCVGDPMYGAIDPIPELAEIALKRNIHMHVDAAWGGFIIPFLRDLGIIDTPDWDFRVPGVCSITTDPHKLLFCPMPAGGILFKNEEIRKEASYSIDDPDLGHYSTQTLVGSRSGAPIVCLWALLKTTGYEGYLKNAEYMMQITRELIQKVCEIYGIENEIEPQMNLVAFRTKVDAVRLSEEMGKRGWRAIYALKDPPTFRCIVLPYFGPRIPRFVSDLEEVNVNLMKQ